MLSGWKSHYHEQIYAHKSNISTGDSVGKHPMMNNNKETKILGLFILCMLMRCNFVSTSPVPSWKLIFSLACILWLDFIQLTNMQDGICSYSYIYFFLSVKSKNLALRKSSVSEGFHAYISIFRELFSKLNCIIFH